MLKYSAAISISETRWVEESCRRYVSDNFKFCLRIAQTKNSVTLIITKFAEGHMILYIHPEAPWPGYAYVFADRSLLNFNPSLTCRKPLLLPVPSSSNPPISSFINVLSFSLFHAFSLSVLSPAYSSPFHLRHLLWNSSSLFSFYGPTFRLFWSKW